jgi:hypothetical protein
MIMFLNSSQLSMDWFKRKSSPEAMVFAMKYRAFPIFFSLDQSIDSRGLKDHGLQPDHISFNLAMASWDRSNWPQVLQLVARMREGRIATGSSYVGSPGFRDGTLIHVDNNSKVEED